MMGKAISVRTFRRMTQTAQAIFMLGVPFLKINGESALRFDIPTMRLHVFGCAIGMQEFYIVLIASIFLTLMIAFVTLVFGRIWCGWLCPQTVIVDLTSYIKKSRDKIPGIVSSLGLLAVSTVIAASLIWYFVSPYEFFPRLMSGNLSAMIWTFWIGLTVVMFFNFAYLRHKWCASVCPYAKMQSVLFDKSTLIIEMDPKRAAECIDCKNCSRVCPTNIDIRNGLDAACINCAECLDACNAVMLRKDKKGLIHYAFGNGGEGKILRTSFFVVGGFMAAFFALYAYTMATRTGLDFVVMPHNMEPRVTKDGGALNAYVLSLRNMLDKPVEIKIVADKFDETVTQSVDKPFVLGAGQAEKMALFVRTKKHYKPGEAIELGIAVEGINDRKIRREVSFVIPDGL